MEGLHKWRDSTQMEGLYTNRGSIHKWRDYTKMEGLYTNGGTLHKWRDSTQPSNSTLLAVEVKNEKICLKNYFRLKILLFVCW